jgi:hypothetical protein
MKNQEHQIQVAICNYLDWLQIPYFAIPNGGMRDIGVARKLKAEGVKSGVADLFIMQGNQLHNGLFIEVKTMTGKQQETQKNFEKLAFQNHYCYEIVRSLDELKEKLNTYLKIK